MQRVVGEVADVCDQRQVGLVAVARGVELPYVPCVGRFGRAVAVQVMGASRVVRDGFAQGWW